MPTAPCCWNGTPARTSRRSPTPTRLTAVSFSTPMLLLPALDAALELMPASPNRLIDVGSGAGFPGLPIKIMRPDLDITLIEATGKKVAFLDACIAKLGLSTITTIHGRAEDFARDPAYRERFDVVTARAVASLPALLELGMPFLRLGGRVSSLRASILRLNSRRRPMRLLRSSAAQIIASRVLPRSQTTLVAVAKVSMTPKKYPRRAGIPAREPLGHLDRSMYDQAARRRRRRTPESVRSDPPRAYPAERPAAARGSS